MPLHFFKLLLISFFLLGCTAHLSSTPQIQHLSTLLRTIDKSIPKEASGSLSQEIYKHTQVLGKAFKLTSPPTYHNFLVSIGAREKGLCYDWSDALYIHLKSQKHPYFTFHLMGSNIGEYWSEHNALVISSKNHSLDEAILIDPWRNSGELFFSKVKDDKKYQWTHRPKRCKIIGEDKFYP